MFLEIPGKGTGSSPLTRGKLPAGLCPIRRTGLIPAHAGKTSDWRSPSDASAAHPRSRGENGLQFRDRGRCLGSSPLTRGKPSPHPDAPRRNGLIPAHAGKTYQRSHRSQEPWAHPRSRGENKPADGAHHRHEGSSPLTRGKLPFVFVWGPPTRLIPAHAGKTACALSTRVMASAHPRSRGENGHVFDDQARQRGSSPLTRGKP